MYLYNLIVWFVLFILYFPSYLRLTFVLMWKTLRKVFLSRHLLTNNKVKLTSCKIPFTLYIQIALYTCVVWFAYICICVQFLEATSIHFTFNSVAVELYIAEAHTHTHTRQMWITTRSCIIFFFFFNPCLHYFTESTARVEFYSGWYAKVIAWFTMLFSSQGNCFCIIKAF